MPWLAQTLYYYPVMYVSGFGEDLVFDGPSVPDRTHSRPARTFVARSDRSRSQIPGTSVTRKDVDAEMTRTYFPMAKCGRLQTIDKILLTVACNIHSFCAENKEYNLTPMYILFPLPSTR